MLLILAGVSLNAVFSQEGIFSRAEKAGNKYNEAKAKEILETVLMADAQTEKYSNPKYNQDDFLDELIKKEIPETDIKGDVAIIDGWAFELDRSVPKIKTDLGQADKLVFPTVNATVKLADDKKNATIEITAMEETNGINKIEIWQLGEIIKEYTYEDVKTEITVNPPYTAMQNGTYIIKVYGNLMASKTVKVEGILASAKFEPNGNEEWQKSHTTTVTIQETADKVVSSKYYWINSVTEPTDDKFTEEFKSGDTITGEGLNGTNYLWVMLETGSGEKVKWRSEGFNFDNQGPNITAFTPTKYSETAITLSATAQDTGLGTVRFEFYVDDVLKDTQTCEATTASITKSKTITGLTTGNHNCKVIVYDAGENSSTRTVSGTTKLYTWDRYGCKDIYEWKLVAGTESYYGTCGLGEPMSNCYSSVSIDKDTGSISYNGVYGGNLYKGDHPSWWESGPKKFRAVYTGSYNMSVYCTPYSKTSELVRSEKDTTKTYSAVTSTNKSAYPSNGKNGSYWYVYVGVK